MPFARSQSLPRSPTRTEPSDDLHTSKSSLILESREEPPELLINTPPGLYSARSLLFESCSLTPSPNCLELGPWKFPCPSHDNYYYVRPSKTPPRMQPFLSMQDPKEGNSESNLGAKAPALLTPSLSCPSLPNVVISDFCEANDEPEDSSKTQEEELNCFAFSRSLSTCSSGSTTSSLSWDDDPAYSDLSDTGGAPPSPKKVSKWRKIRSAIHWSPFIQTYHKYKYPWVQLAGHQGNFKPGNDGTIFKKMTGSEEICLRLLMKDALRPFVPQYYGKTTLENGKFYIKMQDLLGNMQSPCCVMDVKLGTRTYLEEELAKAKENPKLRKDMYTKMAQIDPNEPTELETKLQGITKPRYMVWRETISSTSTLGFRIEGIKNADCSSCRGYQKIKNRDEIVAIFKKFTTGYDHVLEQYLSRLKALREVLDHSVFFKQHEIIGSSLLFINDDRSASIWMIDFAKTQPLCPGINITHKKTWEEGNHEDGYITGLENLISIFEELQTKN